MTVSVSRDLPHQKCPQGVDMAKIMLDNKSILKKLSALGENIRASRGWTLGPKYNEKMGAGGTEGVAWVASELLAYITACFSGFEWICVCGWVGDADVRIQTYLFVSMPWFVCPRPCLCLGRGPGVLLCNRM